MPEYTTNLNLEKPAGNENFRRQTINSNMDKTDTAITSLNSQLTECIKQVNNKIKSITTSNYIIEHLKHCPDLYSLFKNTVLELPAGENNATATAYDGDRYLYIGCNTSPAIIVKVDSISMERVGNIVLNSNECRVHSLIYHNKYIYHGSYTNPYKISKINAETMQVEAVLEGIEESINDKYVRTIIHDGNYLYVGCDCNPGKIVKIDLKNFTRVTSLSFSSGENSLYDLIFDGAYLYAVCDTVPTKIIKIDPITMQKVNTLELPAGDNNGRSMVFDGYNLYIGCATSPAKLVKIDVTTFQKISDYTFETGENEIYGGLLTNGDYIYAVPWFNSNPKLVRIDARTMTRAGTKALPLSYVSYLIKDGFFMYSACDTNPAKVIRIFAP